MSPRLLLVALQLLTRVPVGDPVSEERDIARSVAWFPVVGAMIGGLGAFAWWATTLPLPSVSAATLAVAVMVLATGGLHWDGLADTADGLFGGDGPDSRIEIMRDSRLGTYGALALVLVMLLKVSLLAGLGPVDGAAALVVSSALGRAAAVVALWDAVPARPDGAGALLLNHLTTGPVVAAGLVGLLATALFAGPATPAVVVASGVVVALVRRSAVNRLGGLTGDVIGAMVLLGEVAGLAMMVGLQIEVGAY